MLIILEGNNTFIFSGKRAAPGLDVSDVSFEPVHIWGAALIRRYGHSPAEGSLRISSLTDHIIELYVISQEVLAMVEQIQNEYATADDRDVDISRIPADLVRALLPFQVKGIKFALQKEGSNNLTRMLFCYCD